jgi:dephospho-CoA kinase
MCSVTPAQPPDTLPAFTVGLTGGIGSGKSTVAEGFSRLGIGVVDADNIAHQLTAAGGNAMPALREAFGPAICTADGALDRTAMRTRAFSDAGVRKQLESILHPMIHTACQLALRQLRSPYAMLAVPLLIETGTWIPLCKFILVVDCPPETQIKRVMQRSALDREEIVRIMATQASRATRLAAASDIIDNSGTPAALLARIQALHNHYLHEYAKPQGNS